MTHPHPDSDQPVPPSEAGADILPFKARSKEELSLEQLSLSECVSYYIAKWSHPSFEDARLSEMVNVDAARGESDDKARQRLREAIDASPLFNYYDELLEADRVTLLLDSLMRSTQQDQSATPEGRKALGILMGLRGTEVLCADSVEPAQLLDRLPLGDEGTWQALAERLASER